MLVGLFRMHTASLTKLHTHTHTQVALRIRGPGIMVINNMVIMIGDCDDDEDSRGFIGHIIITGTSAPSNGGISVISNYE